MKPESPAKRRAKEIVGMLKGADGPDPIIDRAISQLFRTVPRPWTSSLDDANVLVKKYYQRGFRQYLTGEWGAYVEVHGDIEGFVWTAHRSVVHALLMAMLLSYIAEME